MGPTGTLASMPYRRDDIEQVRAATDLVELVGEVTKVTRSGRAVVAVCPFHQEKAPSLSIDPARGLYHCFGCGKSGDLFRFVQETQAVDFNDAVELLARRSGIVLQRDPEAARRRSKREALIAAVEKAVGFYHLRLRSAPDAATARAYLRGRGYEGEEVGEFRLGYSPPSGDALVGFLRDEGVPEEVMIAAGLCARGRTGRLFDRFRDRVMFPIFDLRGDPVGFGARLLAGEGPKYLNSPDSAIYQKSRLLYGLNWAKADIVRHGEAVVVEGYTDVMSLARSGLGTAVATCGTALGVEHLDLLRRFTGRVVLMFDADEAGVGASLRGFEHSVPGDLDLRVALLPVGRDPADLVASGETDAIREAIGASVPLLGFRIEKELERFDLGEAEARGRAVRAAAALVARHPDEVARHEYAVEVARATGVALEVVTSAVEQAAHSVQGQGRPGASLLVAEPLSGQEKAERDLLRLMLANHPDIRGAGIDESLFTDRGHQAAFRLLWPALEDLAPGAPPDLGALLGDESAGEVAPMLAALAMSTGPRVEDMDVDETVRGLQARALDRRLEMLRRRVNEAERAGGDTPSDLLEELIALERRRKALRSPS
jgi:DNA primase